jgi:hypothetical protein
MNNQVALKIILDHNIDGIETASVPIANTSKYCTLYRSDFSELVRNNAGPKWNLFNNHIMFWSGGKFVDVCRLIMDADKDMQVIHLDGDRLNLCRDNLAKTPGYAKRSAKEFDPALRRKTAIGADNFVYTWRPGGTEIYP